MKISNERIASSIQKALVEYGVVGMKWGNRKDTAGETQAGRDKLAHTIKSLRAAVRNTGAKFGGTKAVPKFYSNSVSRLRGDIKTGLYGGKGGYTRQAASSMLARRQSLERSVNNTFSKLHGKNTTR